jgi:hypothetical protein
MHNELSSVAADEPEPCEVHPVVDVTEETKSKKKRRADRRAER